MYSNYAGDTQYPHGAEIGSMRGPMPVDPSGAPARYPYIPYYGPKGPDGAQLAAAMSQRPPYGGEYAMGNPEAMYAPGWNSMIAGQAYMSSHGGKPPYNMGYPGASPGYPGPPHPFSSGGQYSYGGSPQAAAMAAAAGHPSLIQQQQQQQQALSAGHRFTPPTEGTSSGSRSDINSPAIADRASYPGGMPGAPWQSQNLSHARAYRAAGESSPAAPPGSGGGAWPGPPSYQGPDYPSSGPSTPNSSSRANSKAKGQDKGGKGLSQKQQMEHHNSPRNSELHKVGSISSLRDALLATTASSSMTQQYASYSSPRMGEHQASPVTPSTNLPITPESNSVLSPQVNVTVATRQDSQLLCGGGGRDQDANSRQNSTVAPGAKDDGPNPPPKDSNQFPVESILGIEGNHPIDPALVGVKQLSSPMSNSLRDGGGGGGGDGPGSNLNSPHTQSPHGMLTPNIAAMGMQEGGRSPGPGRPDLLGFPARSPSFRESQPSPLTEDGKTARKLTMSPIDRSHPSISSQYDGDQKRKDFLDSLFSYLEKEGIPLVRLPAICKTPFDLYGIFNSVRLHGGFLNVMEKRLWRDVIKAACGGTCNPMSSSLRTVQQYYAKLLLPYECHLNNLDISVCLMKLENSRHTSLSSPCSQISSSSDSESKERAKHLSEVSKFDGTNSMEGRVNGETTCVVPGGPALLDGELLVKRVNSQDAGGVSGNGVHLNSSNSIGGGVELPHGQPPSVGSQSRNATRPEAVNSHNHATATAATTEGGEQGGLGFSEDSAQSSYAQAALAEPLPEMSVQDAESVLGMSPTPFPAGQDGPTTPSGGVPSPTHFPPGHFQQKPPGGPSAPAVIHQPGTPGSVGTPTGGRGGASQDYNMEVNEASTPGSNSASTPPTYPPPYPVDMSGYHPSYGSNYPPYNSSSYHRQYDGPPEYHPGMPSHMMHPPYPSSRSPYSGMPPGGHQAPMDYPGQYHPHLMHPMGGMRDPAMYPRMSSDWHWQQQQQQQQQQQRQQQMMSSFPPHLQQSHMYHRMQQHHQQQQAMNVMRHQQQQAVIAAMQQQQQQQQSSSRGSPGIPSSGSPGMDPNKLWLDQNQSHHKNLQPKSQANSALKPQLKHLEAGGDSKVAMSKNAMMLESGKRLHPDWSNCVEGTKPQLAKRRKLYGYNCGHVEPWRLMMSLKSGVLADSTWALDTLTILLHDESTYGYFNLKHHHSLLDTIVSHFKVLLSAIFDIDFEDDNKYLPGEECLLDGSSKVSVKKEEEEGEGEASLDADGAKLTTESLLRACQTDYNILEAASVKNKELGTCEVVNGLSIPVANVYRLMDMKLGKSDDLSHISVPTLEDSFFPKEEVDLEIMSERERSRLERDALLQRIDQTPVSVLLQREALLTQIPLHRFSRLSHSPRRRDRNFFGDTRRRESLIEDQSSSSSSKDPAPVASRNTTNKRESKCVTPPACELSSRISMASDSPDQKKEHVPPPILREESEVYRKEELPLWAISPARENLESRCKCISNILRSLTFVPGNDVEFCQHPGVLIILGKLLMMHHYHLLHKRKGMATATTGTTTTTTAATTRSATTATASSNSSTNASEEDSGFDIRKVADHNFPPAKDYWWWHCLDVLREDTFVILANISGQLDLSIFPEKIAFPIIDGLLHWLVCPSSVASDPLPDTSKVYSQSPQRLVVETLAKMTISEVNVDLILATPPLMRLDLLFSQLGQMVGQKKYPVVRQFALVLLSNLAQGNESSSRLIGQQKMVMSLLLECLEIAEHMACMGQGSVDGGGYGKEDPTSLSVAMLRRAASTLHYLSRVPANRTAFLPCRDRILYLSTSQYVEPSVSSILMDMLYEFGKV